MEKPHKDFTEEEIKKAIEEFGFEPFVKNYKWTDEHGNKFSSWSIGLPGQKIHTGDGGAELFFKLLDKRLKEWAKDLDNEEEKAS